MNKQFTLKAPNSARKVKKDPDNLNLKLDKCESNSYAGDNSTHKYVKVKNSTPGFNFEMIDMNKQDRIHKSNIKIVEDSK